MSYILIAYASTEGHSHEIAKHLAVAIERCNRSAAMLDVKDDIDTVNAVMSAAGGSEQDWSSSIVIGSVHFGGYDDELFGFAIRHAMVLGSKPGAFLSVSLSAASDDETERDSVDKIARDMLLETGWQPAQILHVAGAVKDKKLNFFKRGALQAVLKSKGIAPDPTGKTVFTDWQALDEFIVRFIETDHSAG